ncbi:chondroadherin-like protein [Fukomys damarensis]|uniref:chondroadherin-like protein n=1 Tax=Fukomys damarensis TaxID=885580 RepID=UPI00053FF5AF|nr:chondroadherin-like protein [Fukomys damarensis]
MEWPQRFTRVPLLLLLLLLLGPAWHTAAQRCPQPCICDNARWHVSCRHQNLTEVPGAIPELTQRLDLQGNVLRVIPPAAFRDLPHLTHLDLRHCQCAPGSRHSSCEGRRLQAVPRGFPNDTQLLDLRRNHFPSVPREAFPGLSHLMSLHLQHCGIAELESGALTGLDRLLYLYLSDNQLSGLSAAALQGAPHLGYLYLERNRFLQVPGAALRALPSLVSLHLQDNALERLGPGDLAGVRALRWLYLGRNRITQVSPGALGTARELEKLYLDRNQLREVPTGALEGLPALQELQLSGNPLRALHDGDFRPMGRSLQHLFLNSSGLEQISPGAFSGLGPGLQSLHLQKNELRALPALPRLIGLELIDLSGNPFHCDCQLLPLHRWLTGLNLRVGATCATPPSARGQRVKAAVAVFEACPDWAARKAKRTPASRPGTRRTSVKGRP